MLIWSKDGIELKELDFGITDKGATNRVVVQVENQYLDNITLTNPFSLDEDVKIVEFTEKIPYKKSGTVTLEFTPTLTRKESLKMKKIGFRVLIG